MLLYAQWTSRPSLLVKLATATVCENFHLPKLLLRLRIGLSGDNIFIMLDAEIDDVFIELTLMSIESNILTI